MAYLHRHPSGEKISAANVTVDGDNVIIGLWGYLDFDKQELFVTDDSEDLYIEQLEIAGNSRLYKIRVRQDALATKNSVTAKIYANTVNWQTWDWFQITFRFQKGPAGSLVVRPITAQLFGGPADDIWRATAVPSISIVDPARYTRARQKNPLEFRFAPGKPVHFAVFAAKLGAVERAFILIVPTHRKATNLLIVITHGFGQNDAYYSSKGYSNPLSLDLIRDVTDRFGLERWGAQLFAARDDTALLLPVRARAGGSSELGPFITHGAEIIERMVVLSENAFGLKRVDLVTFSSGIYEANQFVAAGARGISIDAGCAQDPAGGAALSTRIPSRRQFLSGYTTHFQPRPGFEYLPEPFWVKEPQFKTLFPNDRFNYMHTHCIPDYTLFVALATA